jgi:hypothetical protein
MLIGYSIKLPLFIVHPAGDFRRGTKVTLVKSLTLPPEGPAAGRQTASRCSGVRSVGIYARGNHPSPPTSNPRASSAQPLAAAKTGALLSNRRFFSRIWEWQAGVQS